MYAEDVYTGFTVKHDRNACEHDQSQIKIYRAPSLNFKKLREMSLRFLCFDDLFPLFENAIENRYQPENEEQKKKRF